MDEFTPHSAAQSKIIGSPDAVPGPGPGPEIMGASTLGRDDVYNLANEKLGTIEEIMIDVPRGRVAYVVMSHGGILGIGDKLFAIPWSALTLDTDRHCFLLNVDVERLKNAEGFDKDHWPRMADVTWAKQLHEYYDQPPYW